MFEDIKFEIPTEEEQESYDLDRIVQEFSGEPELPEQEDPAEADDALVWEDKRQIPVLKILGICCASLVLVAAIAVGIVYSLWHQRYQAAQPEQKTAEVFSVLFKNPDWELLYTMAGLQDTPFENRTAYAAYMDSIVGDNSLSYVQIPCDDPLQRQYIVACGETAIGGFTMTGTSDTIPDWKLGAVALSRSGSRDILINKTSGGAVYVNGVALDESYTIRSVSTLAENYLPEGVHGYRLEQQLVTGLLMEPTVVVVDENGAMVTMAYDIQTNTYSPVQQPQQPDISQEHQDLVLQASKETAAFLVSAVTFTQLRQYYDTNSGAYAVISATEPLLEKCSQYSFDETATQITNYRLYDESAFSATVTLKLDATLPNGNAQSFDLSWNFLFCQNYAGSYLISEISQQSFHLTQEKVRLTFMNDDTLVHSVMVSTDAATLQLPSVTAPEGMTFAGWASPITDSNGNTSMGIVFAPSETGEAILPQDGSLEPMTLYAMMEPQA